MCSDEYDVTLIDYCYHVTSHGVIATICIRASHDPLIDDEIRRVSEWALYSCRPRERVKPVPRSSKNTCISVVAIPKVCQRYVIDQGMMTPGVGLILRHVGIETDPINRRICEVVENCSRVSAAFLVWFPSKAICWEKKLLIFGSCF